MTRRRIQDTRSGTQRFGQHLFGKLLTVALLAVAGSFATGCAIHAQAPIKEVAYDFSDHAYYDRNYAPSPSYAPEYQEYAVEVPAPIGSEDAEDGEEAVDVEAEATQLMLFRQPTE